MCLVWVVVCLVGLLVSVLCRCRLSECVSGLEFYLSILVSCR